MLHGFRATLAGVANLTIAVDDDVLRRARIRALELDTSVNALLRGYLNSFAGPDRMDERRKILDGANEHARVLGTAARSWTRDDLHDR